VEQLYEFLDQNSDESISLPEFYYLHELTKTVSTKREEEKISLPSTLQGLETGSLRVRIT
jgi:hypothetical protein